MTVDRLLDIYICECLHIKTYEHMDKIKDIAELLKVAAHPARLTILKKLEAGFLCVSDLEDMLGVAQPNISQHLALMRRSGLVDFCVRGKQRCYYLKDPRVLDIISITKKRYKREIPAPICCAGKPSKSTKGDR